MTPIEDRLAATVRCGVIHSGDDQERLIAHKQAAEAVAEIERLRAGHCTDCCCAQSWKALGIDEYTGKSIPEEITHLREWMIKNRDAATELQYQLDDATKEIERLRADAEQYERVIEAQLNVIDQQAAKIRELEADVLQKSILCDSIAENCNGLRNRAWKAEGKIGPEADAKPREGLYGKYRISKADGSPVDPNADYFVLRLDTDPVARRAAREYSYMTMDRKLALELQKRITRYNPKMMDCINLQFFGVEKPRVWQITKERKAALKRLYGLLVIRYKYSYPDETETLRAMLTEAGQK